MINLGERTYSRNQPYPRGCRYGLRISDLEQLEEFLEEYESEDLEFYEEIRDLRTTAYRVGIW